MAVLSVLAAPAYNPSVGSQSGVALVVTVNDATTGDPVTGLQETNFTAFGSAAGAVGPDRSEKLRLLNFNEHPPGDAQGAYLLGAMHGGGDWGLTPVFIIDVATGADRGRAMTSIRF